VEPYNYIYNKRSSFLDSKFVYDDYKTLEYVLSNCLMINPNLLDALAYGSPYKKCDRERKAENDNDLNKLENAINGYLNLDLR
jgi:hypothetical protein